MAKPGKLLLSTHIPVGLCCKEAVCVAKRDWIVKHVVVLKKAKVQTVTNCTA